MTDAGKLPADTVAAVTRLVEVEAIRSLKAAYLRCLDLKQWDELATLFCEDATASYGGGAAVFEGAGAILAFIEGSMGAPEFHSAHRCTQPEIDLVSDVEATGTWALIDTVIDTRYDICVQGAAFYEDRYRKVDGAWRIAHTGYRRTFEEIHPRGSIEGLRLSASLWSTGGRSDLLG